MPDDDLTQLTDEQLEECSRRADEHLHKAQEAYNSFTRNISDSAGSPMPVASKTDLQELDDNLRSAGDALHAVNREWDRRRSAR